MFTTLARFALAHLLHSAAALCAPEVFRPPTAAWPLERLALHQQLACFLQKKKPKLDPRSRLFWVLLRRFFPTQWKTHLRIVKPDTVVRWHRQGVRLILRRRSRTKKRGRNPLTKEVRALIHKMSTENRWGATRIHGELLKLGVEISERTVSRYLKRLFPFPKARMQQWRTFLRNEAVVAMDFVVVPTVTARFLYALVIFGHGRRNVLHVNVTEHPTAAWVSQQLREAFPGDGPLPKYLIHDNDRIFGAEVKATIASLGIASTPTAIQSPWQNGICERFIGTVRSELLEHVIVLSGRHLLRLLREFIHYYNQHRTHLTLNKDSPLHRPTQAQPAVNASLRSIPHVGGLHHHYEWTTIPANDESRERIAA